MSDLRLPWLEDWYPSVTDHEACYTVLKTDSAISDFSSCPVRDIPAGWYYMIHNYPANYSHPDAVCLLHRQSLMLQ